MAAWSSATSLAHGAGLLSGVGIPPTQLPASWLLSGVPLISFRDAATPDSQLTALKGNASLGMERDWAEEGLINISYYVPGESTIVAAALTVAAPRSSPHRPQIVGTQFDAES